MKRMAALFLTLAIGLPGAARAEDAASDGERVETLQFETPSVVPLLHPSYGRTTGAEILLTDSRLSPRRVVVQEGETVVWRSLARQASRIVFEREVARSMICQSVVNFEIEGDTLRSGLLHTGDRSSFCQLAPGRYRYRIVRNGPDERPTAGGVQLSSRLEGVLVVEPNPGTEAMAAR